VLSNDGYKCSYIWLELLVLESGIIIIILDSSYVVFLVIEMSELVVI